jgi:dTDP-4-amino-4,6-dideoxygalactose transaminase
MTTLRLPSIPITRPLLGEEEVAAAAAVIRSGWLTQGARVAEFEETVAGYLGAKYAVACSSCTTALHMALQVAGIGPGDEVIVPSMSFIATANAVRYLGATPVFAEIDPRTYNLDPDAAAALVTPRTRAILPVHQIGMPVDLDRFRALAGRRGLLLIEDAACAIGSSYRGRRIGGDSELACFSFHPRKVISTGEGGMIVTNNAEFAERLRLLRQHGMSLSDHLRHGAAQVLIEQYLEVGYNYRMTDVQAAIGIEQMKRLDGILAARRELALRYTEALRELPGVQVPFVPTGVQPNWQSYAIRLTRGFPLDRNGLLGALLERGIAARRGIMTIHREPAYRLCGALLPVTEAASDEGLLLPIYPQMTAAEQDRVIAALFEIGGQRHATARAA